MNDTMIVYPNMAGGLGKKRPDLHFDVVKEWPAQKIMIEFHLPRRPMTKTTMLNLIRNRCQPALTVGFTVPDDLHKLHITKLRKLAGYDRLEKGLSKEDYIRIIREGK